MQLLMASANTGRGGARLRALRAIVEGALTETDGESVKPGRRPNGNGHHATATTTTHPVAHHARADTCARGTSARASRLSAPLSTRTRGRRPIRRGGGFDLLRDGGDGAWCSGNADGGAMAVAAARVMRWPNHPSAGNSPVEAINALRAETIAGAWTDCVSKLVAVAREETRAAVRDDAILTLQRVLLASDGLNAPATHWVRVCSGVLMPLLEAWASGAGAPRGDQGDRRTNRSAGRVVRREAFLQYLPAMLTAATPAQFAAAWTEVLDRNAEVLKHARSEELREAVPEAVKNMLLVMSAQGVLAPGAPEGIWETTWKKAAAIDAGLTPAIVGAK